MHQRTASTFQFHIKLKNVHNPEVRRRVMLPAQFTFFKFHKVIQAAFGWWDCHLFQFIEFERSFSLPLNMDIPDPETDDLPVTSTKKVKVGQVFPFENKIKYIYDFGDSWEHIITLEQTFDEATLRASVIDGSGACPPEDCGGYPGYENLKKIMNDPGHEEYEDFRTWLNLKRNQVWDATAFDLKKAEKKVAAI